MSGHLVMGAPETTGRKSCQLDLNLENKGRVCLHRVGLAASMSGCLAPLQGGCNLGEWEFLAQMLYPGSLSWGIF